MCKLSSLTVIAALIIAASILMIPSMARAWHVTVVNQTGHQVYVGVHVDWLMTCTFLAGAYIDAGKKHTFDTGGKCPIQLKGDVIVPQGLFNLAPVSCMGVVAECSGIMGCCCWDIKFSVKKRDDFNYYFHKE